MSAHVALEQFPRDYAAVVIGGGAGIGEATALLLGARGVDVTVADRDGDAAEAVAAAIRDAGGIAASAACDVTDEADVRAAFDCAVARCGRVHAVVNSAGIQGPLGRPSHEVEIDEFERTLAVNLTPGLTIARVAVPHFLEHGYGRILHVASIAGKEGNPNMIGYSASKAGLIGLVKAQGKEYSRAGITVNALAPAVIRTPFLDSQPQSVIDYMLEKIPMGRTGELDEVAEMIAFVISPAAGFTTGFTFDLSGGRATY
ncbi:SDR family NAD(P)-dependent oxidoreductase [Microbacterium sp. AK031]|uniref:SDR family NAD(P)-dependent oxidoreductase n=1 Tax=Microbacterium sp. AK031 TaxID=2723076 RepID=UPI0021672BC7|nr:SDR family NAD(P)-dependent oxidoreductase [Microbacterium sp. AK031]MCS3844072.1 3-oxoacyl-[acyl-carrier protein] reductase [Microbacterium sp. AK031]